MKTQSLRGTGREKNKPTQNKPKSQQCFALHGFNYHDGLVWKREFRLLEPCGVTSPAEDTW